MSGPVTILVVEDEPTLRLLAVEILGFEGYVVHEAEDGILALSLLDAHPEIKLLVTDIRMPRLDGFGLIRVARQRRPDLKILAVSGHIGPNDGLDVPLLRKPWRSKALVDAVSSLI